MSRLELPVPQSSTPVNVRAKLANLYNRINPKSDQILLTFDSSPLI